MSIKAVKRMKDKTKFNGKVLGYIVMRLIKCTPSDRGRKEILEWIYSSKEGIEASIGERVSKDDISIAINDLKEMRLLSIVKTPDGEELIVLAEDGIRIVKNEEEFKRYFSSSTNK
jgi:hypothetical protein